MKLVFSNAIFLVTILSASTGIILVLFPAFIIQFTNPLTDLTINPFEIGAKFYAFIFINFILLILFFLYKIRKPHQIYDFFQKAKTFEISRRTSIILGIIILTLYAYHALQDLFLPEVWPDFYALRLIVLNPSVESDSLIGYIPELLDFRFIIERFFVETFGNWKLFPVIISGLLLIQTYFLSKQLSKKRISGIVSMAFVLQSGTFLQFDSSFSYIFLWFLLFLFSIYTMKNKWFLSPISFLFGIISKPLVLVFFPITIFYIVLANIPSKQKIRLGITYGSFVLLFVIFVIAFDFTPGPLNPLVNEGQVTFSSDNFWRGFASNSQELRYDNLIVFFLIPLILCLFFKVRQKLNNANIIMIMITVSILFTGPILYGIGETTIQPYRNISLVVFFALGLGFLFSNHSSVGSKTVHNK